MMASKPMEFWPPPLLLMVTTGGRRTKTLKFVVALSGGEPLSATRTVIVFVLGAWSEEGVQANRPPLVMVEPDGWASSEKARVCAGESVSWPTAVRFSVWPRRRVRSAMGSMVGAVLA